MFSLLDAIHFFVGTDKKLAIRNGNRGTCVIVVGFPHLGGVENGAILGTHYDDLTVMIHGVDNTA